MASHSKADKTAGWKSDLSKERIQKAAFEVFAKKGFTAASTRLIAKKAKLNISLISRYFGGKEQLFKHVVRIETEKVIKDDLGYEAKDSLREELRGYIFSILTHIEAHSDFFRIAVSQALLDTRFSEFMKETVLPAEDPRLRVRLERLKELGALPPNTSPRDIEQSARSFVVGHGILDFLIFRNSVDDIQSDIESFLNVVCREK